MTAAEFAQVGTNLTTTSGTYVYGRVNINTASAAVLACLSGGTLARRSNWSIIAKPTRII